MERGFCNPSGDIVTLNESFERALRAENRVPRTIAIYTGTVTRFAAFLAARELPAEG